MLVLGSVVIGVVGMGATPCFELVGAQSRPRVDVGSEPWLVPIALRDGSDGVT